MTHFHVPKRRKDKRRYVYGQRPWITCPFCGLQFKTKKCHDRTCRPLPFALGGQPMCGSIGPKYWFPKPICILVPGHEGHLHSTGTFRRWSDIMQDGKLEGAVRT